MRKPYANKWRNIEIPILEMKWNLVVVATQTPPSCFLSLSLPGYLTFLSYPEPIVNATSTGQKFVDKEKSAILSIFYPNRHRDHFLLQGGGHILQRYRNQHLWNGHQPQTTSVEFQVLETHCLG